MGQLINRLVNYAKSEMSSKESGQSYIDNSDAELKKIIDELNRTKNDFKAEAGKGNNREQKAENSSRLMTAESAFAILGIQKDAAIDEIKSAYKKRVLEYHPDRVASLGSELKELAGKKTLQINEAYSLLRKLKGF